MSLPDSAVWLPWLAAVAGYVILLMVVVGAASRVEDLTQAMKEHTKALHSMSKRMDTGYFNVERMLSAVKRVREHS